jgi:outer membrane receptor protein involved in Fe transport
VSASGLLAILLLVPGTTIRAQDLPFTGRIVDERQATGIAGATVSVAGLPGAVKTDRDGHFVWTPLPPLPFTIIVVLPGGQVASPIVVDRVDGGPMDLAVNPLADESLTVVGAAPSVQVAPASGTTLLSARQIARRSPEHLLQAVENVPGVNRISEGHAAVPAIRGMARGRTLLLIDGGRVSTERRVGPSATFADPTVFEGIDVARGPGSVAYGSDALGGVISVRTRRAEPGSPLRLRGTFTLGAGIPERRAAVEVSKGLPRGGVILQVHAREADDWDSPAGDGKVANAGWRDRGFAARFDQQIGPGVLSAGLQSDFARDVERPRNNSHVVRFYYPFENSHRLTASYEIGARGGFQQILLTGFLGTSDQRTEQDTLPTAVAGRAIERADVSANDFHLKAHAARGLGSARLEFGIDMNGRYDLEALETRILYDTSGIPVSEHVVSSVDSARRADVGAYLQTEFRAAGRLETSAGLRVDHVTSRNHGGFFGERSTSAAAVSGFAAAAIGPFSGVTFTGQVSRGFRDPTLSDRYYRGPSGRGFVTGNPDLDPETSLQLDFAARYSARGTQVAAYLYQYRINDLIERYPEETDSFFFRNRGRARLRGAEIELRRELGAGFSLELGGSIARGVALDVGADLDDVAADTLSVVVQKEFGSRAFAQARGAFMGGDDRPGPSEVKAPGATIVDLSAGYTLTRHLELRTSMRNLLDDSYYASPDPRWVYAPGRSASVTLAVRY